MRMKSRIPGFYKLSPEERINIVQEFSGLSGKDVEKIMAEGLVVDDADKMIENVIGTFEVPLGIATNFTINDKDYLIPMATEEPSVVAAASNAARIARKKNGFKVEVSDPIMIGQVQICNLPHIEDSKKKILENKEEILEIANEKDPVLVKYGGGAKNVEVKSIETGDGEMLIVNLLVDCRDAMGANAVNTMAEAIAPYLEELTGGRVFLRIISNLAIYRTARARATFSKSEIGDEAIEGVLKAFDFAASDPFRCATHNKGIMNGVSAVVLATGNDTRAIEAGAHGLSAFRGGCQPLTKYQRDEKGDLLGEIEIPVALGIVGGATAVHPVARACIKILNVKTASELGGIIAAVGLAQNFAALLALSTEGIQKGHMNLHERKANP
jgi:hydroxymethylglutaryl-CoA reductase